MKGESFRLRKQQITGPEVKVCLVCSGNSKEDIGAECSKGGEND